MDARAILDKLVSFQTVSNVSNLDLIDWVEDYLKGHGVSATRVYNDEGNKASLYANVGPEVEGGVVLSGHTDVVPVEGQAWDTDPFTVVEKDGKLYGRGTCDMKGFDALALAAVPLALKRGVKRPLQIALSYDEEVGCLGAPPMIAEMRKHLPAAGAVVVGEPSMMKAVSGHKGGYGWWIHVHGFEVHSSLLHTGVNAIMYGVKLIEWANQINDANIAATPSALAAQFDPPFTTLHTGKIWGGTAHNITAKDCEFGIDFRLVPGDDINTYRDALFARVEEVEALMQAVVPETRIEITQRFHVPPLQPEQDGEAERLVRQLTGDNASHVVSYGTEAGQFQEKDYSAIICGPGDIAQAHQPNEFLEVSQFEAGQAFMAKLVDHLAS
ncbi:acetylornithine deacetylase [Litoreibacter ascidiaceicola]|uniref:Acetylornithine deacetylase n=1 Tax=Litoreibacter ascidiaceicola TaxID=1486859 RepID=A0A1M4TSC4_9RHOB|nr:acetylornithine deacetylase [Litoreibacter ascidiaceicola]SHE47399.1 acetylornithine deacetylase [Litoreibacter ascidiaceicola]